MSEFLSYEKFLNQENFYTQDEIINQFGTPTGRNLTNSLVIKNEELFNSYQNVDLISISSQEEKKVSKKLIHDILSDTGMFKYIQTNLDNDLGIAVRIDYIIDKDSIASIKITKAELIDSINQIIDELTQKEKMRFAVIKNSMRSYSCEQRYRDYIHQVYIDGHLLDIKASILIKILTCDEETFVEFLNGNINFGYDKECLAYALVDFIERQRIFIKYDLPEVARERYNSIKNYSLIDYESLNKNRVNNDLDRNGESVLDKITISDELNNYLNEHIDKTYSKLEKAIYYYLRLCEVLTYDQNYFLAESTSILENHESIENINSITPENNQIIKYDFVIIFAKILSLLKIDFTIDQNLMAGSFSNGQMLSFRYGEYLISLNSIANLGESDLTNVKINDEIVNLSSINKNYVTKIKFRELVNKIYNDINLKREKQETFKQSLEKYKSTINTENIKIQDKIYVLLLEISRQELKGIDAISYQKKLFKTLFGNSNNVSINFLCRENSDSYLTPITIVSVLKDNNYTYFMVDLKANDSVSTITKEQLTNILGLREIYYINEDTIPGISKNVGEKYVR